MDTVFPNWLLVGIQTADENVVVPAIDGPLGDGLIGCLFAKVGVFPLSEEDLFCEEIRQSDAFSGVPESCDGAGFKLGY